MEYFLEALADEVGKDFDAFDLICHVAWGKPPLTRKERVNNVKKRNYFEKYGKKAQAVIEALLDKYVNEGITNIEGFKVLSIDPFSRMGIPIEIVESVGGREKYIEILEEIKRNLYAA